MFIKPIVVTEKTFKKNSPTTPAFIVKSDKNFEAEKERLTKDIEYFQGFLRSIDAKLSNERFVQNAKEEVVENERKKKEDALSKLKILEAALGAL
jgi:valyl-tRNA synthetase